MIDSINIFDLLRKFFFILLLDWFAIRTILKNLLTLNLHELKKIFCHFKRLVDMMVITHVDLYLRRE